jgi:hypothetical protein
MGEFYHKFAPDQICTAQAEAMHRAVSEFPGRKFDNLNQNSLGK